MRPGQETALRAAIEQAWYARKGSAVMHVTAAGVQTQLTVPVYDLSMNDSDAEGLTIGSAGIQPETTYEMVLLDSYLATRHVSILPTDHYLIAGERYDPIEKEPIQERVVPEGDVNCLIVLRIRRAVELNSSTSGTGFTIAD
jgi:hypothetical protein